MAIGFVPNTYNCTVAYQQEDAHRAKEVVEEVKETVVDVATHTKEVIEAKVCSLPAVWRLPAPSCWLSSLGPA